MIGSYALGASMFGISDSKNSTAFDVLIKISEIYRPQIPSKNSSSYADIINITTEWLEADTQHYKPESTYDPNSGSYNVSIN